MKLNLEMFNKNRQSLLSRREGITSVVNRYVQSETTGPTVRESNRDQYYQSLQRYSENNSPMPLPEFLDKSQNIGMNTLYENTVASKFFTKNRTPNES